MWHGLSGVLPGPSTVNIVLKNGAGIILAHANVHFDVVEEHGRLFGVNLTSLVDGHATAAYFRAPANRSVVQWDPDGISLELLSLNFIPGRNGYSFRISGLSAPSDVVETQTHRVSLRLAPGTPCLRVHAYNTELGQAVGPGDTLCIRVVPPEYVAMGGGAPPDCQYFKDVMGGASARYGLVIDTPRCEIAQALATACASCRLVLCVPQEVVMIERRVYEEKQCI